MRFGQWLMRALGFEGPGRKIEFPAAAARSMCSLYRGAQDPQGARGGFVPNKKCARRQLWLAKTQNGRDNLTVGCAWQGLARGLPEEDAAMAKIKAKFTCPLGARPSGRNLLGKVSRPEQGSGR